MFFNILRKRHSVGQHDDFLDEALDEEILDISHFRRNYKVIDSKSFKIREEFWPELKIILHNNLVFNIKLNTKYELTLKTELHILNTSKKYDFPVYYRNFNGFGFYDIIILIDSIFYGIRISNSQTSMCNDYLNNTSFYTSKVYRINYDGIHSSDAYEQFKMGNFS